jgi:hypothetical protein
MKEQINTNIREATEESNSTSAKQLSLEIISVALIKFKI